MRQPITPTIDDVAVVLSRAASVINQYLADKVPSDREGFYPTKLSGEEDLKSAAEFTALLPLIEILNRSRDIRPDGIGLITGEQYATTWHSRQYEVCSCTGDESDSEIARIYRESIQ